MESEILRLIVGLAIIGVAIVVPLWGMWRHVDRLHDRRQNVRDNVILRLITEGKA